MIWNPVSIPLTMSLICCYFKLYDENLFVTKPFTMPDIDETTPITYLDLPLSRSRDGGAQAGRAQVER